MKKTSYYVTLSAMCAFLAVCGKDPVAPPAIPEGVATLDNSNFSALTNVPGRVSMIDFYSPNSPACKAMDSSVERIAQHYKGKALVGKVVFVRDDDLAVKFDIFQLPTFLFLNGGTKARELEKPTAGTSESPALIEDTLTILIDSLLTSTRR
jgi:thiol-disulfide isomerase/thioredoxin